MLGDIAVDKYVTGSALELSPLFSNAAAYTEAEQKDSLSRLALDSGAGSTDEMLALSEDLAKEQAQLSRKQQQVADLVDTLDSKLAEANAARRPSTSRSCRRPRPTLASRSSRNASVAPRPRPLPSSPSSAQQAAAACGSGGQIPRRRSAAAPRGGGTRQRCDRARRLGR